MDTDYIFRCRIIALSSGLKPSDLELPTGLFTGATLPFPVIIEQKEKKALHE